MTSFKKTGWIAAGFSMGMLMSSVASAEEGLGPVPAAPFASAAPAVEDEPRELPSRGGAIAAMITGTATTAFFGAASAGCISTFSNGAGWGALVLLAPCGASFVLTPLSAAHLAGGVVWLVAVNKWRDRVERENAAHWTNRVNVSLAPTTGLPGAKQSLDGASVEVTLRF